MARRTGLRRRILSLSLTLVATAAAGLTAHGFAAAATTGVTYYLDATGGSDANAGTSSAAPWKSLGKLTVTTFKAGDQILLKAGQVWSGTADNQPGVTFKTGWDGSKKTGGIVFDTTVTSITAPGSTPTILNDLSVQNSTISDTSFAGIVVKQYTGDATGATATGWGSRTSATDTKFSPHTNVVLKNNYISQAGTAYGCNGIYLTDVRGAQITGNTVYKAGTSGIEAYFADNVTIAKNEVYGTTQKAGGADYNGIDPDKGTTNIVVQYNFVHDNGDGILLCQFVFGSVTVRYNVLKSNTRYPIYLHSDKAATADIYHNTVYNNVSGYLTYGYGSSLAAKYTIRNNVYASTKANAVLTTSSTITYQNNLYAGTLTVPATDTGAKTGDPKFVNPGVTGPYGTATSGPQLKTALAFALTAGSPAIDTGLAISGNGGVDFAGATLYHGAPDIGALEYGASVPS
ncbi:right-handed parallel beta-helix repeat-containing protein [Actinoplanes sp. NPDC026619]|uniref:right-handed parallel beta-helix repeat-containing protein n=1 Tax=Actinoplanes sp. NPDC026619 TaxID=3155798 RepID=UPI0033D8E804